MQNAVAYPIESVDNALRLLLLLRDRAERAGEGGTDGACAGPGLGIVEAARQLGVAPSTAHRIFAMLVYHGFAVKDVRRHYHLGPAFQFGEANRPRRDLRTVMHPHLKRLSRQIQETVHLIRLEGTAVHFVDGVEGTHALRVGSREGMVLTAHNTAGGKALLAQLSSAELRALYSHGLPVIYGPAATDLDELCRQLAAVRRRGYAINQEESERGITSVAVCLRDSNGRSHAALAAAIPTARCPNSRIPIVGGQLRAVADATADELCEVH
jgi:IclR family acetate operon transcriptional repressor